MPLQEYENKILNLQSDRKAENNIEFNKTAKVYFIDSFSDEDRFCNIKSLLRLDHLNHGEKTHVENLIWDNFDRFFLLRDKLRHTNVTHHTIPTTDNLPIYVKQYRYPPVHQEEIDRQLNDLLENIQPSKSLFNSPLWIVLKKRDSQG